MKEKTDIVILLYGFIDTDARVNRQINVASHFFNVKVFSFYNAKGGFFLRHLTAVFKFAYFLILNRPKIVIANDFLIGVIVAMYSYIFPVKIYTDLHEEYLARFSSFRFLIYGGQKLIFSRSMFVTVVSQYREKFCYRIHGFRPLVLGNTSCSGIQMYLDSGNSTTRKQVKNIIKLVYLGGIISGRYLEDIVSAVSKIKFAELDIYGRGALLPKLEEVTLKMPNIKLHNAIPNSEVLNTLSRYDIGLLPLDLSNFNNKSTDSNKIYEYITSIGNVIVSPFFFAKKMSQTYAGIELYSFDKIEADEFGNFIRNINLKKPQSVNSFIDSDNKTLNDILENMREEKC